ncbi:NAD(P)-binding protein [Parathielavia appendiculata]|uniref:NAD(P)-binding protein n=1 Tax=Parathielavia appendiculata TaxID=2587402 RepID=A0AAN6TQI7_9PEZI|nr:NAD(P)-binding protein [Parathielavia appendiculata]
MPDRRDDSIIRNLFQVQIRREAITSRSLPPPPRHCFSDPAINSSKHFSLRPFELAIGQLAVMADRTALVTGASGYIALHVVKSLLDAGWTVHATVRSLQNEEKIGPLRTLSEHHPSKLRLFEADLLIEGSFLEPMQGCSVVLHVASPFLVPEKVKNAEHDLVRPAVDGTRNVLDCVNKTEGVKRVVLTSSVAAMYGDNVEVLQMENQTLHERYWNVTSTAHHNAYQYSKTLAEKQAWKMVEGQSRWELVVLCPGLVLGPSLSPASDSGSLAIIDQLLSGIMLVGVPDLAFALVDVRDVATAHLKAAETPQAKGRYIISENRTTPLVEISKCLKQFHDKPALLPSWNMPHLLFRLLGPLMGLSQKWLSANLGIRFAVDNRRAMEELGLTYRPAEETLREHYQAWKAQH